MTQKKQKHIGCLRDAAKMARDRKPFRVSRNRVFANHIEQGLYVVYSWGMHWPLYVYDESINTWYGCSEKYSKSTSNHARKAMPIRHDLISWQSNPDMLRLVEKGSTFEFIKEKVLA